MARPWRKAPFKTPVPVRYAMWRLRGRPGAPHSWGTRLRMARRRYKTNRARLRANPALARHRPWYAPWRLYPGGRPGGSWRSRFRAWRRRRRAAAPRTASGRPLGLFARVRRRWQLWRGRPGPGAILLRARPRGRVRRPGGGWLRRTAVYLGLARPAPGIGARRRRAPMPWADRLPMGLGWLHRPAAWADRQRLDRWMRRRPAAAPVPPPPPAPRRPPVSWTGSWSPAGAALPGRGARGGGAVSAESVHQAAEDIAQFGRAWDPHDADSLHGALTRLSEVSGSVADAYDAIGEKIAAESGLHSGFADVLESAAGSIRQHADQLDAAVGGGLLSQDGNAPGESPEVRAVTDTVHQMAAAWEPGDDPDILEQSVQAMAGLTRAVHEAYAELSTTVSRTGAHESYPDALDQASAGMRSVADGVDDAFAGGVLSRPGG
jgi:hypothetical protein